MRLDRILLLVLAVSVTACSPGMSPHPDAPEIETRADAADRARAEVGDTARRADAPDTSREDAATGRRDTRVAAADRADAPAAKRTGKAATAGTPKVQRGQVSLYGRKFEGNETASGEVFDADALTMAHRTLPFGTRVRVTNLENQRSVEVVVNDRGPFVKGRIADLSLAAARRIGMVEDGVVDATLEVLAPGRRR